MRPLRRRYGHLYSGPPMSDVLFEPSEGWWVASLPGTPGVLSQGKTKSSAYKNLIDAMVLIEGARQDGLVK